MQHILRSLIAGSALLVITGCPTGPSARRYVNGRTGGIITNLELDHGRAKGELLEVQDTALVLARGCGARVYPFRTIKKARFQGIDMRYLGRMPGENARTQMRLVSRFPGGMPAAVRDAMAQCPGATVGKGAAPGADVRGQVSGGFANVSEHAGMPHAAIRPDDAAAAPRFLATARESTRRFQQLDTAIAAGYRRIGGDVPSLGEHWIHPATVMSGVIGATRPSVLIYVRTGAGPRLAGVAWTTVLRAGQPYPDQPVGAAAWHEHNGTVAEETLPLNHHPGVASGEATRVAILHAWIWIENPRGVWLADNWALPFARAGLRPDSAPVAAARALSLTAPGADAYYQRLVAMATGADSAELARAREAIAGSVAEVSLVRSNASEALTAPELARLTAIWNSLWSSLAVAEPQERRDKMLRLAEAMR